MLQIPVMQEIGEPFPQEVRLPDGPGWVPCSFPGPVRRAKLRDPGSCRVRVRSTITLDEWLAQQ